MKKSKLKKRVAKMETRINKLESPTHEVRVIGFQQLYNLHADNDYVEEGEDYGY